MNYNYNKLLQPIKINGMRLRNRIMMSGMGTFTPMVDGTDSEEGIRYYEERAKGGAGLIMTGAMFLNEKTAQGGPTLALHSTRAESYGAYRAYTQMGRQDLSSAQLWDRKKWYAGYWRESSYFSIPKPLFLQSGYDLPPS